VPCATSGAYQTVRVSAQAAKDFEDNIAKPVSDAIQVWSADRPSVLHPPSSRHLVLERTSCGLALKAI